MNMKDKRFINTQKIRNKRRNVGITIFFIVAIIFLIFIGRFFYIGMFHTVGGVNLEKKVAQLYANKTQIKAKRGTIYDKDGNTIAEDTTTYSVYIVLSKKAIYYGKREYLANKDKDKAAKVLSKYLSISYADVLKILNQKDKYQVELGSAGKGISLETKKAIESKHITGIDFTASTARLYPNGAFASYFIGLTTTTNNKLHGLMGIEKVYNHLLSGVNGTHSYMEDSTGTEIPGTKTKYKKAKNGDNLYTTLDSQLQVYMETLLKSAQKTYHPKEMTAVLMDAKTGAILAASQRPTFNAQTKSSISEWQNILLDETYEPGSTMKVFTTAAAINSGIFNGNATYSSGSLTINGSKIYDWNKAGWGYISYNQAFIRSSNVGMALLEQQMGSKTWLKYIKKFGFLKSTNAHLGSEATGSISYTYPIEQANTAYGQGIDVTVFQMMQGFTAIANNGKELKPYMIKKIVSSSTGKTVYKQSKKIISNPIKATTAKQVRNLMAQVVTDENGTGSAFKSSEYTVGVKTGTAQIASSNGSGYLTGSTNYIFSVVGMAPINNPRYILYVTMKQPQTFGSGTSGEMLASVFNPLMERAIKESSSSTSQKTVKVPSVKGQNIQKAKTTLSNSGLNVSILGSGSVVSAQSTAGGKKLLSGGRIILKTSGTITMPDISGWSRSDVIKLETLLGIKVNISGSGYVTAQSVTTGTNLSGVKSISVTLK
ncbi:penicillin-binding protein [Ligilactobacillus sp. WILCCON 0076]|uniref:Penicillin-binding protein n=1 Tax=Ligilactobacillus ubinensis TaxID=2876789 RepID=A0A9X2JLD7_9LACO|nr:penicillin-binding transpeptidase domain-containing protein [Ligilactobacillus ubinensis]MCP0886500.1 penicillin-binding protein [Ligilactobacillus ubinensis]